ncbi:MAG: CvpA family protein [Myxococcota bacterium]|nr:CvpA family protein [Myxococcota bacterium]
MVIDFFVLFVLVLMSWLGHRKGFAAQVAGLAAIVAVYFLAIPAASLVRNLLFAREGISFPGVETASIIIAGVIVFLLTWLAVRFLAGSLTTISERIESIDAIVGAIFGFLKAVLFSYLFLCVLVYAESPLSSAMPALGEQAQSSLSVSFARRFNIITRLRYPELSNLRLAMEAADDPDKAERNESLQRLLANDDFKSVMQDESLMQAAAQRNYSTLLADERVLRLLADEDFRKVLSDTDWDEVVDE